MVWYDFRKSGVPEYLVHGMPYSGFNTALSVDGE